MSVQTQNTNLNPYSNTPIKNLEYIQNKALVIAPFEITKSGKLDPDLLLDTPGIININIYKKMVSGEDKEPTADQFKTIKTISDLDSSNRISTFDIPVIFKYNKETNTRIIEKDLTLVSNNLDYIDFAIDVSNTDLSSETGSNGFFCVCQVQKIQKSVATTTFTEVANDEFLFMIPSVECREIPELVEFDLLDINNKVINIKKFGLPGENNTFADIYKDKVSLLLDGNDLTDKTGKTITNTGVTVDTSVKKYGSGSLKFSSGQLLISSTDFTFGSNDLTIEGWFNFASLPSDFMLFDAGGYLTANGVSIEYFNNKLLMTYNNNHWIFSNNSLIINTWYHIAITRNNNTIYLYLDGIKIAQLAMTQSFDSDNKISLGCAKDLRWPMNGYIDDFRVTKGIARYTANFTPPNELSYVININEQEQGYRIHPVINISDHVNAEESFTPKYYLGSKYQRNLMEVLAPALKSKRTIYNLKDMYLVDDMCIQTLKKINILLENNQMIKLTERLYNLNAPLREKLNADVILEYLSTPVSGSQNSDIATTLKTSLMEDYHFTQEEIDNLNDNLNTFKSRARIALTTPVVQGQGLDQLRFNLPKTFIDGNRSKTEKKNLLVFGTDAGFNKFNLAGYTAPYSNISKRETSDVLDYDDLILGLTTLSGLTDISTIKDFQMSPGDYTQHILFENGNLYACRYVNPTDAYSYNRDGRGFNKQSFPLKLINTNVKSMYCGLYATFIIDNNNDVWALGGYAVYDTSTANPSYDIYGINSSGNHLPNWTKVFNSTPENTPKKVVGTHYATWLLMESGELFCTGYIPNYHTFDGITKSTKTWISLASGVLEVDCGQQHVCYTLTNGEVYAGNYNNESGLTTQSSNNSTANTKVLKILTYWIPINQTIIQIECTYCNTYYLLSNGDVYGVGYTREGQLGYIQNNGYSTPIKLYTGVKRIVPQLFGHLGYSVSMVELITGKIKCMGHTQDYKFGYYAEYGVTTPKTLYPKVDKIFLTEKNILAIIDGKIFNSGYNSFSGTNLTNPTITEQVLNIATQNSNFKNILTDYKQQIPFTYIPLSTNIDDMNIKPVFESLTDITGFVHSDIVIDVPNVL